MATQGTCRDCEAAVRAIAPETDETRAFESISIRGGFTMLCGKEETLLAPVQVFPSPQNRPQLEIEMCK